MPRCAYVYLSADETEEWHVEARLRRYLAEYARLEGLHVRAVFVDRRNERPSSFEAMITLLHSGDDDDVRIVVLPDLGHVAHIPRVAHLTRAGLARHLGAAVLLAEAPAPARLRRRS